MFFNKKQLSILVLAVFLTVLLASCGGLKLFSGKSKGSSGSTSRVYSEKYSRLSSSAKKNFSDGLLALKSGRDSAAKQKFLRLTRSYPNFGVGLTNLGIAYYRLGDFKKAEEVFIKSSNVDTSNVIAQNYLGILYRKLGRFKDAANAYRSALKVNSNYAYAHLNLGILYDLYLGNPTLALKSYQRYQELVPKADKLVNKWIIDMKRRNKKR